MPPLESVANANGLFSFLLFFIDSCPCLPTAVTRFCFSIFSPPRFPPELIGIPSDENGDSSLRTAPIIRPVDCLPKQEVPLKREEEEGFLFFSPSFIRMMGMSLILGTRNAMQECGVLNVCTLSPRDEWVYPNECYNVHRLLA